MDKASVEVFAKDYTAAGAAQIFPSPLSVGAQVLVEGAAAKADITIYPLSTIWTEKAQVTEPQYIGSTQAASQNLYVGETRKLTAYVLPTSVSQEVIWSVKEGSDVAAVDETGTVTALQKGTAVIVAASAANPALTREFTIQVTENNFRTNIPEFVAVSGNWIIDDETLSVSNVARNDYYMSAQTVEGDFVLETDIRYTSGLINLFLASEYPEPHTGAGAYTIQFGYDTNVRLFPFGRDDYARGTLASPINDGEYHHVKVVKSGQSIAVYVDDVKCLEHTFAQTEAFFANGHVGIGLWDGALDVQNFFVHPLGNPFTDVDEEDFFYDSVLWAVEKGITTGTSDTTFSPYDQCVRAQVVTFLWRAAGSPEPTLTENPFVDVSPEDFYYKSVLWAVEKGITTGLTETHFGPLAPCNRAQVVTFLHRALGEPAAELTVNPFIDVPGDAWYAVPVLWALEQGITTGVSETTFGTLDICNRAQLVTFLYRAFAD